MNKIEVKPVCTRRERTIFLTFPWRIYRRDPLWVPPLLPDWRERIDPQKGAFFKIGTADFFIAWRDDKPVGTICAAEDIKTNADMDLREGMFGFFNFIEDYTVMEALICCARQWAQQRGLNTLTGPFNLDREDSYGILIEGRDRPPALMCGHTPPYYLDFIERYGFEPARDDNLAFCLDLDQSDAAINDLARMAERVSQRKNFVIRNADLQHWQHEIDRIHVLLNKSLTHLTGFRPWQREMVDSSLAPFRQIVDPQLVLFAELGNETVGWFPGLPNLNEYFMHVNGLRHPWDYLTLWWLMHQRTECLTVKSVLVLPEYWGSGVAVLLFYEMLKRARAHGYRWMDLSLTSADNPRTPILAQRFGAKLYKRYRVYQLDLNH